AGGTATAPLMPKNLPSGHQEHQKAARRRPSDWALARPWLGVGKLRNNAKLLHPERVPVRVFLDDLAVRKAGESTSRDLHALVGGGDAHQVTVVLAAT